MAFAGGPLNHFTFQALVRVAAVLRADPGSAALVTAVSGILTKQGVSLWSSEPPPAPFGFDDATEATARATETVALVEDAAGPGRIATYTVLYEAGQPARAILLCDLDAARRTLRAVADPALAELGTREELCGRAVRLGPRGEVVLT
jgi:acetyl-CoA C-acetyltransferase